MSLQQIIAEVREMERSIRDQLQVVNGFSRTNDDNIRLVGTFLAGSTKSHDQRMIEAIREADKKLVEAKAQLERASQALERVQMI